MLTHARISLRAAALNPRESEVYTYAVEYIKVRSWGIMAAMLGFVASGSYRGIKDTATPLKAAMGAAATNMVLTPLLIIGECSGRQAAAAGTVALAPQQQQPHR